MTRSRRSGTSTGHTGAAGVRLLAEQLGRIPEELRTALRPRLRRAGEVVRREAASRASWSSRIPGAIRTSVAFTGKSAGVHVKVLESAAPHARPYEGLSDTRSVFRHPVFGDEDRWVSQAIRPFLLPALQARSAEVLADIEDAIDTAARAAGFR